MRCAYCHDDLDPWSHRCEACGSVLHLACWDENRECTSLGCGKTSPRVPDWLWLLIVLVAALFVGAPRGLSTWSCGMGVDSSEPAEVTRTPGGDVRVVTKETHYGDDDRWSTLAVKATYDPGTLELHELEVDQVTERSWDPGWRALPESEWEEPSSSRDRVVWMEKVLPPRRDPISACG